MSESIESYIAGETPATEPKGVVIQLERLIPSAGYKILMGETLREFDTAIGKILAMKITSDADVYELCRLQGEARAYSLICGGYSTDPENPAVPLASALLRTARRMVEEDNKRGASEEDFEDPLRV